ncbi:hypothetical protein [Pedobacter nototheniae]|uniref:hypothetical protein n=1 Tax=Pedobacter nototheniae TaxID=2488994 RepID=UPI00103C85B8|nr:hypothetical protein [Pedobacter nototheniae]
MKKVLLGVLFIVVIIASYLVYDELSFSPLKEKDFKTLFKGYIGQPKKICSKDFLGMSSHGELFEIYLYRMNNALINNDFPKLTEWEHNKITNETIVGKWKNCPLDYQTIELYKFTLISNNLDDVKCCNSFNKEILNPKNYYSFVHFNGLEQYFLIYCTDSQELYYIRRKGF